MKEAGKAHLFAPLLFINGILLAYLAIYLLASLGLTILFFPLWLSGIVSLAGSFWINQATPKIEWPHYKVDGLILAFLVGVAAILYLPALYDFPKPISTDEFSVLDYVIRYSTHSQISDLLGLSEYNSYPTLMDVVLGHAANLIGGIDFLHLRMVHAICGILCVIFSYLFFRTLDFNKRMAASAALLVGFNHALVTISRTANRVNSSLLVELVAYIFLFSALRQRNQFLMYIGGFVAGLGFYVYNPARTTMFTFLSAALTIGWLKSKDRSFASLKTYVPALISFCLTTAPMLLETMHTPERSEYQSKQFLFNHDALNNLKKASVSKTQFDGYCFNVRQGLLTFNGTIPDYGYYYWNIHAGFVDYLTGALMWVGLVSIFARLRRPFVYRDAAILCAISFLELWFLFTFFLTMMPCYTRLLTILPFVSFLTTVGADQVSELCTRLLVPRVHLRARLQAIFFWTITCLIIGSNLWILILYARDGDRHGVGVTFRYAQQRMADKNRQILLVCDDKSTYFFHGEPWAWKMWVDGGTFQQRTKVISSREFEELVKNKKLASRAPVTIFLLKRLWEEQKPFIEQQTKGCSVTDLNSKGRMAIDLE